MAIGAVLFVLTFLLAFTVYGELSAALAVVSFAAGAWLIARRRRPET